MLPENQIPNKTLSLRIRGIEEVRASIVRGQISARRNPYNNDISTK